MFKQQNPMIMIDLRSDTVTQPTTKMKDAMFNAKVGDDVFGDDPTVNELEHYAAELFGMEAALFTTSGTLTNQLAIKVHCAPGSEIICDLYSHVYQYEGGGIAMNSQSSVALLHGNRGRITAEQVLEAINNKHDFHKPVSRLVSVENTMNKGGGAIYDFEEFIKIKEVCKSNDLKLHLDGARLFNAIVETPESTQDYGEVFDTISICLSKGLGCPVGSLLIGSQQEIQKARRFRKVMGGGWRQAGFLAAAGLFALQNNINRLQEDHARAKKIGEILKTKSFVKSIYPIDTNIVIIELPETILADDFVLKMKEAGILCVTFGKHLIRFVTHLDFTDLLLRDFEERINTINSSDFV